MRKKVDIHSNIPLRLVVRTGHFRVAVNLLMKARLSVHDKSFALSLAFHSEVQSNTE